MKKQWRGFVSGFATAALVLCLAIPAFAAYQKQATLNYNDIKVTLDGKQVTPKDANGNTVEPFVIDGTTYLPVRAVANALGLEVGWNGETKTVTLSSDAQSNTQAEDVKPAKSGETMGQKNALESAKKYLGYTSFSHSGMIKQLEFEGYSAEDSTYAADNCGADWNEQAVKSAKRYLDYSSFSRDGLIKQLEFEGFTHAQAVHGAEANGY